MSPTKNMQGQSVIKNEAEAGYCVKVLQRLNTLRFQGLLCDVTITAEQRDFAAHKGILAASSDYFHALFTTAMIEKNSEKINLDVSSLIVNELLTFLYTGMTDINEENVIELLVAADYLVIHELKQQCVDYLVRLLSTVNCIKIYTLALRCNCPVLRDKTERFILNSFVSVYEGEDFHSLDGCQLECLIKSDDLVVNGEEDVYKAIVIWTNSYEERKPYFERLFSHLRLSSLSEDFIIKNIENEPLVRQSTACISLVNERLQSSIFSCTDDEIHVLQPRKCLRTEFQGLVVVGGISQGRVLKDTLVLNPSDNSWTALKPSECEREEHLVIACKGRLYVIGGMRRSQSIDCFDPSNNTWSTVAQLPEKAITSAGVCLDGRIFIIGGKDGFKTVPSVHCFDSSNNQIRRSTSLTIPRKALCAVTLNGEIYAIGGCTYDNDSLDIVEKMDPNSYESEWEQIAPLRERRTYACAEVLTSNKILVAGGYQDTNSTALDSCEVYSTESQEWQVVCSLVLPRAASAMACIDNQLYVFGGRSDRRSTDTIEYYDEDDNQWTMSTVKLPYPCAWIKCAALDVPKTLLQATAQLP